MIFLALFVSLPTRASTGRMRVWRALKGLGAATLRDGVYLLPNQAEHAQALSEVGAIAQEVGGSAEVFELSALDETRDTALRQLFDRGEDFATLIDETRTLKTTLGRLDEASAARKTQALLRRFEQLTRIDYFAGEPQRQALEALDELRSAAARHFSPHEPSAVDAAIPQLDAARYRRRRWATRARPKIDRLASAWLIRRHIDPEARIVWLSNPADCKKSWLGFDFDGATFTHVGGRVTFEVLATSFGLDTDPAIARIGDIVHCLDVGGAPMPEAAGIAAVLGGLARRITDDHQLMNEADRLFDGLHAAFTQELADA